MLPCCVGRPGPHTHTHTLKTLKTLKTHPSSKPWSSHTWLMNPNACIRLPMSTASAWNTTPARHGEGRPRRFRRCSFFLFAQQQPHNGASPAPANCAHWMVFVLVFVCRAARRCKGDGANTRSRGVGDTREPQREQRQQVSGLGVNLPCCLRCLRGPGRSLSATPQSSS